MLHYPIVTFNRYLYIFHVAWVELDSGRRWPTSHIFHDPAEVIAYIDKLVSYDRGHIKTLESEIQILKAFSEAVREREEKDAKHSVRESMA